MPVTPVFSLRQDDSFVYVDIRVPYVRVSDTEYVVDGTEVSFFCKPYLLKLVLPEKVVDDDRCKAVYDPNVENGFITLHLPKEVEKQHFADLDMLTKLCQARKGTPSCASLSIATTVAGSSSAQQANGSVSWLRAEEKILNEMGVARTAAAPTEDREGKPLIEVLSSVDFETDNNSKKDNDDNDDNDDKESENMLSSMLEKTALDGDFVVTAHTPKYGFNNSLCNFFHSISNEFPELIDLPNPDQTNELLRAKLRVEDEDLKFDEERYRSDFFGADEDMIYLESMAFKPEIETNFSSDEQEQMRQLQNIEFLKFSKKETQQALCAILDVVVGVAYDWRMTQGDPTIESAWTIRILSSTLSWLDTFTSPESVVKASLHRMVTFPYLRQLGLAKSVLEDVKGILSAGKRAVLKCVLRAHRIFAHSELYYLFNRLYITSMCVWVQQLADSDFEAFVNEANPVLEEEDIYKYFRWDLEKIEDQPCS